MRIKVATQRARGWDFKVAAALSRLGFNVSFVDDSVRRAYSFFYPTLTVSPAVDPCDFVLVTTAADFSRIDNTNARIIALVDDFNADIFNFVKARRAQATVWVMHPDLAPLFSQHGIPTVHFAGGVEEEANCVHPQGCLEKANWIATVDIDALPSLVDESFLIRISQEFCDFRTFALSDLITGIGFQRDIYSYRRLPHPAALYPFLAICKIVVLKRPAGYSLPYLPMVALYAAGACNTYVVLIGFDEKIEFPFVYPAKDYDEALSVLRELKDAPPPFASEDEIARFRSEFALQKEMERVMQV